LSSPIFEIMPQFTQGQSWRRVFQLLLLTHLTAWAMPSLAATELKDSPKTLVDEVWQFVNSYYVDPDFNHQNWQAVRTSLLAKQYTSNQQAYETIRSTLATFNDPFTRFLAASEYASLQKQTTGEEVGAGVELALNDDKVTVAKIAANSAAAKADLKVGDQVLSIDGRSTRNLPLERANKLTKGFAGTPLMLVVTRPQKDPFLVKIIREGPITATVQARVTPVAGSNVGYIRLSGFNANSGKEMSEAIVSLKKEQVQGFILDLRDNPGGLLEKGLEIAAMWIDRGVLVQILSRKGEKEQIKARNTALTNLPLVVLVNADSASASEILAGALQDNRRATVIGTKTFGKALVQAVHELSDGSAIVITVAHYYTPKGTDIAHTGVAPDVAVSLDTTQDYLLKANPLLWGTVRDPAFARALEVLATKIRAPLAR
jgi:carboxyl-terminal processing protease